MVTMQGYKLFMQNTMVLGAWKKMAVGKRNEKLRLWAEIKEKNMAWGKK